MKREPIDYNNPLGISKKEITKVLGANLAILLILYLVACVMTLCGNDFFALRYENAGLTRIESTLRGWGVYPFVQFGFATAEAAIIAVFATKRKMPFWLPLCLFASFVASDLICWAIWGTYFGAVQWTITCAFHVIAVAVFCKNDRKSCFVRLILATIVSLLLNGLVSLFRTGLLKIWNNNLSNAAFFALNVEYQIALVLSLLFVACLISLRQKGEVEQCPTDTVAGGSSPITTNSSRKNSPKKKNNGIALSANERRRLAKLRAKIFALQFAALLAIAFLPWAVGKPVEFSLVYVSFCVTRIALGFNRSLHFKSELACITIGALVFWGLTFLAPSVEACLIMAMVYGASTALLFRLYWELRDLILYRKASKIDRFAMMYSAFKGNVEPNHIKAIMKIKGYQKEDAEIVLAFMSNEKVEAIAIGKNYSKRAMEARLTKIATELYEGR